MKMFKVSFIFILVILTGCKSNEIYYWGNYESTLYDYRKEPNELSLTKHKNQLEFIVTNAPTKNKRVPPGVYFELGMIEAKLGNMTRSVELLNLEKSLFPEATTYVDKALANLEGNS